MCIEEEILMSAGTLTPTETRVSDDYIEQVLTQVKAKNPAEPEFHQAVQEVFDSLRLVLQKHPEYREARILEGGGERGRLFFSGCPWSNNRGKTRVTGGFRMEKNSEIAPYRGAL